MCCSGDGVRVLANEWVVKDGSHVQPLAGRLPDVLDRGSVCMLRTQRGVRAYLGGMPGDLMNFDRLTAQTTVLSPHYEID